MKDVEQVVVRPSAEKLVAPGNSSMIAIRDLFEVHMTVADLDRAIAFYRDAIGLRLAHVESARQAAFFTT